MASIALTLALLFALGLVLGSTMCNLTCGPLVLVRIGSRGRGWKDGLILSSAYSLPRVLVLIAFGALVGGGGNLAKGILEEDAVITLQSAVYLLIGMMMVLNGVAVLRRKGRGSAGTCRGSTLADRILERFGSRYGRSEKRYMFGLGMLFSIVCLGEAWGVLSMASVEAALEASSPVQGAFLGAVGMFLFSIGLSAPPVIGSSIASEAASRYDLNGIVKAGGVVLIALGSFLVLFESIFLIGGPP